MIEILARAAAWTLAALITVVTWGPVRLRPQTGHGFSERFWAYLVVAIAFSIAYPRRARWVAPGLVLFAILLEVGQRFVPGRDPHVSDAVTKGLGVLAGVGLMWGFERLKLVRLREPGRGRRAS